jgi:hypothetical protein
MIGGRTARATGLHLDEWDGVASSVREPKLNVRITSELLPARGRQPGVTVLPSMLPCQGRDGPAREVNAVVIETGGLHCGITVRPA